MLILLTLIFWSGGASGAEADLHGALAFTANLDGNWDIFIARADGSSLVRLTETPFDERTPAWSPNCKWIVYSTSDGELRMVDVGTKESAVLPLPKLKGSHIQPCFSPDGKHIVYADLTIHRVGDLSFDDVNLSMFNVQTGKSRVFLAQRAPQFTPDWSPDGKTIVYTVTHGSLECGRAIQELWIAKTLRQKARQLLLTSSQCVAPTWSPDGARIAFASDKNGNFDIWIFDVNTRDLTRVTTDAALDVSPAWSPDGKRIAFISARSGKRRIWTKNLAPHGGNGGASGASAKLDLFPNRDVECRDLDWR